MGGLATVTWEDVQEAQVRLRSVLPRTPTVYSRHRSAWLKLECLQPTGSYKVRGALNALTAQARRGDRRPVVVASAGNHGAGVAWAARHLGLRAVVVVPCHAPANKVRKIRELGARVQVCGETFEHSLAWAKHQARKHSWRFLHAFDDPDVIAGQGTVGLDLFRLRADVVLVPVGGGGLASGMSVVMRSVGVRVVGVQVEGVDAMARYLKGEEEKIKPRQTVADGLRVSEPGALTKTLCREGLDEMIVVSEAEVRQAMIAMAYEDGLWTEGAGAVAVAALPYVSASRPVAVVTGKNVDNALLEGLLAGVAGRRYSRAS